jgi:hypothetical protein
VNLTSHAIGSYYLHLTNAGTKNVLVATNSPVFSITEPTPVPTPVGGAGPDKEKGGSDTELGEIFHSYSATSPGAQAGQTMNYAINELIDDDECAIFAGSPGIVVTGI